ncbi:hypothetical protein [Mesorhizobium sp. M0227]|uniref:hypothetical protein n=1 Tax=Mesorhizobium sp. M0227 TaxID=2956922 RepID=UPI0033364837
MEIAHLIDVDGVLVRAGSPIEGSVDFIRALVEDSRAFQIFTNNSKYTPEDHAHRLRGMGFPLEPRTFTPARPSRARFDSCRHHHVFQGLRELLPSHATVDTYIQLTARFKNEAELHGRS